MKRMFLLAIIAGCSSSSSSPPEATQALGDVRYAPPPSTWHHSDTKEISRLIARWSPEENPNKESISIIRTAAPDHVKDATPAQLEAMLVEAQLSLPARSVRDATAATTKQHLQEVEIAADFVPAGLKDPYHRVHAMIVDGGVLIHVLYTARTPDPSLAMFRHIVDSIRHGGES